MRHNRWQVQRFTDIDIIDGKFKGFRSCDTIDGRFRGSLISMQSMAGSRVSEAARRLRYIRRQFRGCEKIAIHSTAVQRLRGDCDTIDGRFRVRRLRGDGDIIDGRFRGCEEMAILSMAGSEVARRWRALSLVVFGVSLRQSLVRLLSLAAAASSYPSPPRPAATRDTRKLRWGSSVDIFLSLIG